MDVVVEHVEQTGSTNVDLVERARQGAAEGLVLVADHQTGGRGRLGRTWEAPPGSSLLLSVLTRPDLPADEVHLVPTALAVAAAEAIAEVVGVEVALKWPNDLVVEHEGWTRKVGGILAEAEVEGGRITAVVAGIGLNVNWPGELPAELADIAIACNQLAGHEVDREALLDALLRHFDEWYAKLGRGPARETLLSRYRHRSATLGRQVRVETPQEVVEGRAVDLTHAGHLLVEVAGEPEPREISAGDVVHLRPAG